MGGLELGGKFQCPYERCNKSFEKPIVLTDNSRLIRETYYACPHCRSRLEIYVEDPIHPRLATVEDAFNIGQKAPVSCSRYLGYLGDQPDDIAIPDDCAVCPKVVQCFVKKGGRR